MPTILLIISGGIAAYKALALIRLLKKDGLRVVPVLTKGGAQFVTPLSVSALAEEKVYGDLFSLTDEQEMGHIRLSRLSDLVVVAPASADILAKMVHGLADDLASTLLLAANKPVLVAPAMNPAMWAHAATQANIATLQARGVTVAGPACGDTACGEEGLGRMLEPEALFSAIKEKLQIKGPLAGKRALVTAGPTVEPIDPVRFITNASSGKQGYAVAEALARAGADVTLVSGPVSLAPPSGVRLVKVNTAREMMDAAEAALPVSIAVCAAAVADWRVKETAAQKIKKGTGLPALALEENPDILATLAAHKTKRPTLVIGFAAETERLEDNARAKLAAKGCDWLLANDVSQGVFGADDNTVHLFTRAGAHEAWPRMRKDAVARELVEKISAPGALP